jgi:hypothetical protein
VGYSDSAIRVWDRNTSQCLRRMGIDIADVFVWRIIEIK